MALSLALIPFAEHAGPAARGFLRALPLKSEFAALTQIPSAVMIVAIATAVWRVDFRRRISVFYLAAALGLSGLAVEPLKQIAGRARPEAGVLMTPDYQSRLARLSLRHAAVLAPDRAAGRDLWLFLSPDRPFFTDAYASFPSGHATSAFILAAFLCALYPRGRWLWVLLAVGCAVARVRARRHFLEDVMFSGAMGWMLATWAFRWRWPARLADRLGVSTSE